MSENGFLTGAKIVTKMLLYEIPMGLLMGTYRALDDDPQRKAMKEDLKQRDADAAAHNKKMGFGPHDALERYDCRKGSDPEDFGGTY